MKHFFKLLLAICIITGCADVKQQERWPDGDVYKPVERFQLVINPSTYEAKKISIQGYLKFDPAGGGYRLYTKKEEYFSNNPYTAISLAHLGDEKKYLGCHGRYVFASGQFQMDKYQVMIIQVDSIQGVANVPPIDGTQIKLPKKDFSDFYNCQENNL